MSSRLAMGFDKLAPWYDWLARLVIGKGIHQSQIHFLSHLATRSKLLILGGGTGWILPSIFEVNPTLKIDYIDISPNMIAMAKERGKNSNVRFIIGTESNIPDVEYDSVITNFYFDLFETEELRQVIARIKKSVQPGACWIATDFIREQAWHHSALRFMYYFFRLTTGLKTQKLPLWEQELCNVGTIQFERKFGHGFIKSIICRVQHQK
jgi:tRNA (cmo5U34)-methyltransferase